MRELLKILRKHPVITMDKQNITGDAADKIEQQHARIEELEKVVKDISAYSCIEYGAKEQLTIAVYLAKTALIEPPNNQ